MEYKALYKNGNRGGNRLKDGNSKLLKSKRESSRQDLHFTNRNLNPSDCEEETNDDEGILFRKMPAVSAKKVASEKKKLRRSQQDEADKENELRSKYEERLARLRKFKEDRAKAKGEAVTKKKPFIAAAPKNVLLDRSYEKNLYKKSESDLKKMAEKRQVLTPAAKLVNPRVDTRRREPIATAEKERPRRNIMNVKTPASIKQAQPKVDTWRKEKNVAAAAAAVERKREPKVATGTKPKPTTSKINTATVTKKTVASTAVSSRKGVTNAIITGATGFTTYQQIRAGNKSTKFNFKFNNDGKMVTSTNRKKKSLEKLFRPNAPSLRFSPKNHAAEEEDVFAGISPIDLDTPTPKKHVSEGEAIAMKRRETRRRSLIFTVEDVKQEAPDEWEPQVITISDESDPGIEAPAMNESFTIGGKQERKLDRRPTIEETGVKTASPRLVGCGRISLTGRPSLVFVEEVNAPGVSVENPDATRLIAARNGFVEEHNDPTKPVVVQIVESPKRIGIMSPSQRFSGTPRMSFIEEDVAPEKPLPEGNLATMLLNKQEGKRRSSGGSRRWSLVSFREEDQPPTDVREKVVFYYNLVDKELKRLQELCDMYKDDVNNDEIDENSKGLIIAAQGQTNILINKKLSKFKDLVGHYERSWADQKVRTDDLDGFWLMVSLDLENLDRRFEELRVLKENNWQEVVEQPKVKKIAGGGGIKKRDKKPMKTKASGLADLIKKAREEAKRKKMMESALTETVTVVSPVKRSVRIATTPRRSSLVRNSICTGCTPTSAKGKKSRKTIFNDPSLRPHEIVKSILKIPSEKRRAKSVLFLDSGLDTPESHRASGGRKIVHTPKPKITFREEPDVEDIETISLTTPFKLDDEIRKRKRSSMVAVRTPSQEEDAECCAGPSRTSRRKTLRFDGDDVAERAEAADRMGSPVTFDNELKEKSKRTRGKSRGKVSFI